MIDLVLVRVNFVSPRIVGFVILTAVFFTGAAWNGKRLTVEYSKQIAELESGLEEIGSLYTELEGTTISSIGRTEYIERIVGYTESREADRKAAIERAEKGTEASLRFAGATAIIIQSATGTIEELAAAIGEAAKAIEEMEDYLCDIGFTWPL